MNIDILAGAFSILIGVVDFVDADSRVARVEISTTDGHHEEQHIPLWLFPCTVSEGDMFHIVQIDGVTEFRCGEPEPN